MRYRAVKEQLPNLRVVGIERVVDRDAYVLRAKLDSVTTQTSYFDVVTGLLRREITTTETLLVPLEEQVDYDDYRDVSGVQMPFLVRISDDAHHSRHPAKRCGRRLAVSPAGDASLAQSTRWYVSARSASHGPPFREYSPWLTIVCRSAEIVPTNRCEKSDASRHQRHSLPSRRVS